MKGVKWRAALGLGLLALTSGCSWTTTQVVTLEPLTTSYPVSASPRYVDDKGTIIGENDYRVVQPFAFGRTMEGERHAETLAPLRLESDLDRIMAQTGGDAMTQVKIEATSTSSGSHYGAAALKYFGWTFCILGAPIVALAAIPAPARPGEPASDKVGLWAAGGTILSIGILGFVLAAISTNDPATLNLRVSGQVVRRNPVTPPQIAPPPSASELPPPTPSPHGGVAN